MYSIKEEDVTIRFSEILKVNVFQDTITWLKLHALIHFDKKHHFQEIVISKQQTQRASWKLLFG